MRVNNDDTPDFDLAAIKRQELCQELGLVFEEANYIEFIEDVEAAMKIQEPETSCIQEKKICPTLCHKCLKMHPYREDAQGCHPDPVPEKTVTRELDLFMMKFLGK